MHLNDRLVGPAAGSQRKSHWPVGPAAGSERVNRLLIQAKKRQPQVLLVGTAS